MYFITKAMSIITIDLVRLDLVQLVTQYSSVTTFDAITLIC